MDAWIRRAASFQLNSFEQGPPRVKGGIGAARNMFLMHGLTAQQGFLTTNFMFKNKTQRNKIEPMNASDSV
jgi:hypothetical protein